MTMFVIKSVKIGTPTKYCHFQLVVLKVPLMSDGIPIDVKSALMITMRIPMLMKMAKNSLIMILPFIAVIFLYLSNFDVIQRTVFKTVFMKDTTTEIPIYATYLKT